MRDLVRDTSTGAIVDCILDLARSLDLECVAEGVETPEQLERLREGRCAEVQGFLFSRAVPIGEVPALLGRSEVSSPGPRCAVLKMSD